MQITFLTPQFAPRFEGGTERVARAHARALAARGHAVRILSGTDTPHRGADVEVEEVDGLEVRFLPRVPEEAYDLRLDRPRLGGLLAAELEGVDVVHLHHWATLTGSLVRDLASSGVPVAVTLHDLFTTCPRFFRVAVHGARCPEGRELEGCCSCLAPDAPGWSDGQLLDALVRRRADYEAELAAASAVLVPSRAHAERLARHVALPSERLRTVSHGLCTTPLPADGPTALPYSRGDTTLRVLFFGHLSSAKGVEDLARAVRDLPGVELLLLGTEVEPGLSERLARAVGSTPLKLDGGFRAEELARRVAALGGAHLAALPSRVSESYGLVLDEAHALGLPAWVSDRGAPPERVGEAGRVLPAEDPSAWRSAFAAVLTDPSSLAAERAAVPARVRTALDAAVELESLYRELAQPGRSTPSP